MFLLKIRPKPAVFYTPGYGLKAAVIFTFPYVKTEIGPKLSKYRFFRSFSLFWHCFQWWKISFLRRIRNQHPWKPRNPFFIDLCIVKNRKTVQNCQNTGFSALFYCIDTVFNNEKSGFYAGFGISSPENPRIRSSLTNPPLETEKRSKMVKILDLRPVCTVLTGFQ